MVLLELDACVKVAFLVDCYFLVVTKLVEEVVSVAFADVFDAKIIHYEGEDDWSPLVSPEVRGDDVEELKDLGRKYLVMLWLLN